MLLDTPFLDTSSSEARQRARRRAGLRSAGLEVSPNDELPDYRVHMWIGRRASATSCSTGRSVAARCRGAIGRPDLAAPLIYLLAWRPTGTRRPGRRMRSAKGSGGSMARTARGVVPPHPQRLTRPTRPAWPGRSSRTGGALRLLASRSPPPVGAAGRPASAACTLRWMPAAHPQHHLGDGRARAFPRPAVGAALGALAGGHHRRSAEGHLAPSCGS